uniref:Uncharacterized protein n=1 Tax=Onchocerca volvulus TaxID=6282 RepID=A0A8R1TVJ7_ONCVO
MLSYPSQHYIILKKYYALYRLDLNRIESHSKIKRQCEPNVEVCLITIPGFTVLTYTDTKRTHRDKMFCTQIAML